MSDHWPQVGLGELLRLERRPVKVEPEKLYQEIGIYCFGRGIFHKTPRTGFEVGDKDLFLMKEGDFILQVTFAWEGAIAIVSADEDGMCGSTRYPTFRVDESRCVPQFLLNYFKTEEGLQQLIKICPGSAGRNRVLSIKRIPEVLVPLPSLTEQRRMVARIDELAVQIQEACTLRHHAAGEAKALIRASVSALCFNSYPIRPFGEFLAEAKNGIYKPPVFWGHGQPCIRMYNIDGPELNQTNLQFLDVSPEELETYGCVPGDLVFNRVNSAELVGKTGIVRREFPHATFESKNMRLRVDHERSVPEFAAFVLNSPPVRAYYRNVLKQQCGMATLNQEHVRNIPFPNVELAQQCRIIAELDALQAEVDALKRLQGESATELDALLPSILDKAFKGEL
jgi:type I restriction enzyme, S subunit